MATNERRADTIEIGKGVKYAKVATRVAEFHKDHATCAVETSCEFKEGHVLFRVVVTTEKGTFSAHSMAKVGGEKKALEKQETVALGRALAFAGYLASGEIASYEEMEDVLTTAQLNSLKLKFASVNADALKGLDRPAKLKRFSAWCKSVIGEDADYSNAGHWDAEWYQQCWRELVGPDSDVPFEAE